MPDVLVSLVTRSVLCGAKVGFFFCYMSWPSSTIGDLQ